MVDEYDELNKKLLALQDFIATGRDLQLKPQARRLLWEQEKCMSKYAQVLQQRIYLPD
jgi:hypothetical protein